jgi:nitrite reductase/ring-hydroxylating ferredoxin subunit
VLGHRDALPDGQATMYTLAGPQPFPVLLLRSGEEVKVYANRCAHFGVPLAAKQEQLLFKPHISITCNVHYARYRWADGVCESGECEGESLIAIPVVVNAQGQIRIAEPGAANATL